MTEMRGKKKKNPPALLVVHEKDAPPRSRPESTSPLLSPRGSGSAGKTKTQAGGATIFTKESGASSINKKTMLKIPKLEKSLGERLFFLPCLRGVESVDLLRSSVE